ncbi:MAG: peptidoglycan-binding domain-containing protein [Patescibacteria group bacterium]
MKNFVRMLCIVAVLISLPPHAHAQTVDSFTANPSALSNNYSILLTWSSSGATGHRVYFSCPAGVTLKWDSGDAVGQSMACNSRQALDVNTSGSANFKVTNVSGTAKTVSITIYPKNSAGADVDAGARTASFTVTTSPQPINTFTITPSATVANEFVLNWASVDIPATNIQFDCVEGIKIYSKNPAISTVLPCGTPAYTSDLAASGTATITTESGKLDPTAIGVRLVPVIASGSYDGTHSFVTSFAAPGKTIVPDPTVLTFTSGASTVVSGAPVTLTWTTTQAASTSLQFQCASDLSFYLGSTSTTALPCGSPIQPTLGATGSTTISILSKGSYTQTARVTIFPANTAGTFFGPGSRVMNISVMPPGTITAEVPTPLATPTLAQTTTPAPTTVATPQITKPFYTFAVPLVRGSKHPDVKKVQTFLALNPLLYPEGSVTGFYGPATMRGVGRFQEKYGLAKKGDEGYGSVGPKTRAKLNTLATP